MTGRRFLYLLGLGAAFCFYLCYGEWVAGVVLAVTAGLPWLSLLLSIPAMVRFRLEVQVPRALETGEEAEAALMGSCPDPLPPFRGKLRLEHSFTGLRRRTAPNSLLPTEHCGRITVAAARGRVCDYLGLFALPARRSDPKTVLVRPRSLPVSDAPDIEKFLPRAYVPKPGGGFAEQHELRPYRPGDSMNAVHWKLTAKTGSLTIREPMEPRRGLVLLTLTLRGTPEELDRKLGRLTWLGQYLLSREVSFEIRALTGDGLRQMPVSGEKDLQKALDSLLSAPLAETGSIRDQDFAASWQYHIGGEDHA